ncbi:Ctr copper transporter [Mycena belliarum]|uniref:Copper transport protein n=1 Tax=Mycena belliarum TaxID=1033014 RepID=A0AAD6XLK9_9AGAR|nr:Ctr copper transporter [Mycena belliae]
MESFLHFTPGDTVIFQSIDPSTAGAVFRACIFIFCLSVAERWLRAQARNVDTYIAKREFQLATEYAFADGPSSTAECKESDISPAPIRQFILSHELTRGALAGLNTTLHYILMLVVMTFNGAFIMSVIIGVIVGEAAFGRLYRH